MEHKCEWIALIQSIERLRRAWRNVTLDGFPTNKSQMFTLMNLRYKGKQCLHMPQDIDPFEPMTLSGLARAMGQTMPAVSQRISQLEEMGYVSRTQDQQDKRTIWIQLTEAGFTMIQSAQKQIAHRLTKVAEGIGSDRLEQIIEDFDCLSQEVETVFSGQ